MGPIEEIGLLKMDFLGLRNLDVIEDAVEIIERSRETELDIESIPLDDAKTFEMLAVGDSVGVFQLESDGMREALRKVRPTEFDDIVALVSLYRPGAMRYIDDYAAASATPSIVPYADERLRSITESTYGCCIYQEQLMEIAKQIAGFSGAEADDLRKAVGKKKRDLMATMEDKFLEGLESRGPTAGSPTTSGRLMTAAADYRFNKCHAACYALIAYRTAYLKANYPAEYMAALISSVMSTKDKVPFFVNRCEAMGLEVLPPGRQLLRARLRRLRQHDPLRPRRGQERRPRRVQAIICSREAAGPFDSLWDFCERVDSRTVNKRAIESLVKCGALDSTGAARRGMLEVLEQAQASGPAGPGGLAPRPELDLRPRRRCPATGDGPAGGLGPPRAAVPAEEFDQRELLRLEKETLGTFLSAHPLGDVRDALRARVDCPLTDVAASRTAPGSRSAGSSARRRRSAPARGHIMFAGLDDLEGQVELFVRDADGEAAEALEVDRVVVVRGRVDHKGRGDTNIVVQEAERFEPAPTSLPRRGPRPRLRAIPSRSSSGSTPPSSARAGRGAEGSCSRPFPAAARSCSR